MTNIVADEVLGRFARQQHDWFERVRKGSLNSEEVASAVQSIIDRGYPFVYDQRREGWKLVEDVDFSPIALAKLELVSFLKAGENSINGEEVVRRAREELKANLGQRHAEFLLEHQAEIPKEFRQYYLVFTGTVWRGLYGDRLVVCLYWNGERWILGFGWLRDVWYSDGRLVRPRE